MPGMLGRPPPLVVVVPSLHQQGSASPWLLGVAAVFPVRFENRISPPAVVDFLGPLPRNPPPVGTHVSPTPIVVYVR